MSDISGMGEGFIEPPDKNAQQGIPSKQKKKVPAKKAQVKKLAVKKATPKKKG